MEDPAEIKIFRVAALCLLLLLAHICPAWSMELTPRARPGDLIFRKGTEAVSAVVLAMDDSPWSHVGMLAGGPGEWKVLHATPSEVEGRADGVVLDELDFYLDPVRSARFAVYHVQATEDQRRAALENATAALGQPFVVTTGGGTYCTLLVWRAWLDAGVDLEVEFSRLRIPMANGDYLLPGGIISSPGLTLIQDE